MNDKRKLVFGIFACIVVCVTAGNIYLSAKISDDQDVKQLKITNQMLLDTNEELKTRLDNVLPSSQEQQRKEYLTTVETFIETAFLRQQEGYVERKEKAKTVMSEELVAQFYGSETYDLPVTYMTKPVDVKLYLQEHDVDANEVNVIAEFQNVTSDVAENREEKTNNVLRVHVKKENEIWKVMNLEELNIRVL